MSKLHTPLLRYYRWRRTDVMRKTEPLSDERLFVYNEAVTKRLEDDQDTDQEEPTPNWEDPRLQEALRKLPQIEQDVLRLYYKDNMLQRDVGVVVRRNQSDISRRLDVAAARLHYWLHMPPCPSERVWRKYLGDDSTGRGVKADMWLYIVEYAKDLSQTATAERLAKRLGHGVRQCMVFNRLHSILRALKFMEKTEDTAAMITWLEYARKGQYITWRSVWTPDRRIDK